MNLTFSENIKSTVDDATLESIYGALEDEFKKISCSVRKSDDFLEATSVNASFGSILRKDVSTIRVSENRKKDGYVINCDTVYKPSVAFWIFCVIDFVLITTVIGFIIGFGTTLGLYFYNKSLVEKAVKGALEGPVSNLCPASILQTHKDCHTYLDKDSASLLTGRY